MNRRENRFISGRRANGDLLKYFLIVIWCDCSNQGSPSPGITGTPAALIGLSLLGLGESLTPWQRADGVPPPQVSRGLRGEEV